MPEPEIARRCQSCGASIRDRAFFCPQCGNSLESEFDPNATVIEKARAGPEIRPTVESNRPTQADETQPLIPRATPPRPGGAALGHDKRAVTEPIIAAGMEKRGHRVEKIRKISTVVLEQAAYDPSLRFLLVAGFLFFIFLIILIMSKFIG